MSSGVPFKHTFPRSLFVTHQSHFGSGKGGVQVCTQEYISSLKLAGFELDIDLIESDRSNSGRLLRRVITNPYLRPISRKDVSRLQKRIGGYPIVFVNQGYLSGEVARIAATTNPRPRVVLLSHGCEVTDLLHFVRLRRELPLSGRARPSDSVALGSTLLSEAESRAGVDAAITMSSSDADLERWLGVPRVLNVPRTVTATTIDWTPVTGRFGYVGTLDHTPNLDGLVRVLDHIKSNELKGVAVRVVGGPHRLGRWLSERYGFVEYLGSLDDNALVREAKTWLAFLHPIFLRARGASTKLAQSLGWGLPIITTPEGSRGYTWKAGGITSVNSVPQFVREMLAMECHETRSERRNSVLAAAASAPRLDEVAACIQCFLSPLMDERE